MSTSLNSRINPKRLADFVKMDRSDLINVLLQPVPDQSEHDFFLQSALAHHGNLRQFTDQLAHTIVQETVSACKTAAVRQRRTSRIDSADTTSILDIGIGSIPSNDALDAAMVSDLQAFVLVQEIIQS